MGVMKRGCIAGEFFLENPLHGRDPHTHSFIRALF
jgi:hypothetical protein